MDPATAGGLGVGVVSLAFDVFDNSVKLFKFLSSMVDMPKECEQYRLQLMIEYNRLLAWGDAVGLIDIPKGSDVAVTLGTNAIELCSILSRIGWLLGEFRDINARWKDEMDQSQRDDSEASEGRATKFSLMEDVSSLASAYEKSREERKRLRGTDRVLKWMSKGAENAKEIIAHPFRVRWVMVDKEAFAALLQDLHILIERMHQLMGDYREKGIQQMTENAYREMILTRNDVKELKTLLDAVTSLIKLSKNTRDTTVAPDTGNDETLRDLLRLKEISSISERILLQVDNEPKFDTGDVLQCLKDVRQYNGATMDEHFTYAVETTTAVSNNRRPRGVLKVNDEILEAWIEWKAIEDIAKGSPQDRECWIRTAALAAMLHSNKPRHLYSPTCVGYINDRDASSRYGWIFTMPDGSNENSTLKTLHSILDQPKHKPNLALRVSLGWRLASSLLYLHAANWLHKGIHSGNILFSFDGEQFDAAKPILSGFEYSRPQSNKTTSRSPDPMWDIYRWPRIQNEAPNTTNSRKTYDIYSLGLVLLEVAHWSPLHRIMCLKKWPLASAQDSRIRGWLLGEEPFPPFKSSNPLLQLRDLAGDKYWRAVTRCLVAHGPSGMRIPEHSDQAHDSRVGIELQNAFSELVLEELKTIAI